MTFKLFDERKVAAVIVNQNAGVVEKFAAGELARYLDFIYKIRTQIRTDSVSGIHLGLTSPEELSALSKEPLREDSFGIYLKDGSVYILGISPRGVLFGVYTFLEEYANCRWYYIGEEIIPNSSNPEIDIVDESYTPKFRTRGIELHSSLTSEEILKTIDWMGKNRLMEASIDIPYWEKHKDILREELIKRGINLTLGGHHINYFLKPEKNLEKHPEWFGLAAGKRNSLSQPCMSNKEGIDYLVSQLVEYCNKESVITKLSLFPNDTSYTCQCPECKGNLFMESYIKFIEDIKAGLDANGLNVGIEHLTYNASIDWKMLELPKEANTKTVDTCFAFWGRNYHYGLKDSPVESDIKGRGLVEAWQKFCLDTDTRLCLYEYYSDFWMYTQLHPVIPHVVASDMKYYSDLKIDGINVLYFPTCPKIMVNGDKYPWMWNTSLNMYTFARFSWDPDQDIEEFLNELFSTYYGPAADKVRKYFDTIEDTISHLTGFNFPLFRLRFIDIWSRDVTPEEGGVLFVPEEWNLSMEPTPAEIRRAEAVEEFSKILTGVYNQVNLNPEDYPHPYNANAGKAYGFFKYLRDRMESIDLQLTAQTALRTGDTKTAEQNLERALELEKGQYDENTKDIRNWIDKIK